ncbi:methylmalonyl Co-A mutase-associated GTPase MeaB [Fulvivirgaceae bacterium PWU4]|uniref:Methylmalonyl Co-A mutase-associated GTPase MeaB n=1 Tax=Chryseosolibacter histidini TaxID=2782349 RepID=A0AAP2GMM1_9BACT|nr:methylmalonyl Co-A mutase-associated GTPase MeaB [Chryseosolibacter histidini]MBT1701616.1 methylmalonyl Co-A mutase-associated GTPase MeaB [Chryseosolibacter histidini]
MNNVRLTIAQYIEGIVAADRVVLAKAITLVESTRPEDKTLASALMDKILPYTGNAIRIGITGVPGVGKSTFIEAFGKHITKQNLKIAVLTIDPSSQLTRGSILGDKTRMEELSRNPLAFIRPTASGNVLGGVAGKTREAMLLCEAAGYNVIVIETVGVGQSEVAVRNMVDFFLLLMLAGAGDELQGIKKGIMEMADAVVITKADGDNVKHATQARAEYQQALHLLPSKNSGWTPPVLTCSATSNTGIEETWKMIRSYKDKTTVSGYFEHNRQQQNTVWFGEYFQQLLQTDYLRFAGNKELQDELTQLVSEHKLSPHRAAQRLLEAYHRAIQEQILKKE